MLNKVVSLLLCALFIFILVGCLDGGSTKETDTSEATDETADNSNVTLDTKNGSEETDETPNNMENNAQNQIEFEKADLYVNGVKVENGAGTLINKEHELAVIPLIKVMELFGAEAEWTAEGKAEIFYGTDKYTLIANEHELLLEDEEETKDIWVTIPYFYWEHQLTEDDCLLTTRQLQLLFRRMGVEVAVDYSESKVSLSVDNTYPHGQIIDCKLIVKGKDITDGNYAKINKNKVAELPLLAVLRELGYETCWKNDYVASVLIDRKWEDIDTTKEDFNLEGPIGVVPDIVRKVVDNDIIVDDSTLNMIVNRLQGIHVVVDLENAVVKVEYNGL